MFKKYKVHKIISSKEGCSINNVFEIDQYKYSALKYVRARAFSKYYIRKWNVQIVFLRTKTQVIILDNLKPIQNLSQTKYYQKTVQLLLPSYPRTYSDTMTFIFELNVFELTSFQIDSF